jgi:hypothetical protein
MLSPRRGHHGRLRGQLTPTSQTARGASFSATEVAQAVCLQNGWSGRDMICMLASAIEHQVSEAALLRPLMTSLP